MNPSTRRHPWVSGASGGGFSRTVCQYAVSYTHLDVYKRQVLVTTGATVDIVLDPSNPGDWMAHCHIAEHLTAGMMFGFQVAEPGGR